MPGFELHFGVQQVPVVHAVAPSTDLKPPGLNALGAIPILLGLGVIMYEGRRQHEQDAKEALLAPSATPQPDYHVDYQAPRHDGRSQRVAPRGEA